MSRYGRMTRITVVADKTAGGPLDEYLLCTIINSHDSYRHGTTLQIDMNISMFATPLVS